MKNLLADLFPNPQDRTDVLIALVVVALFIFGAAYYILPNRDALPTTPLTAEQLNRRVNELENQRLAFDKHVVTDIEGYRPYYDHRQKGIVHSNERIAVAAGTVASSELLVEDEIMESEEVVVDPIEENELTEPTNETSIIIEDESPELTEEEVTAAIREEVPPNLDADGTVIEPVEEDEVVEEMTASELEAERLAAEKAALAEQAREEKLARERAQRRAKQRKARKSVPTLTGCHVIVGAFSKTLNARSFRDEVKTKNFTVVVGKVRGKMYVGIPVKCNNKTEIKSIQERVKSAFAIDSWVLRN